MQAGVPSRSLFRFGLFEADAARCVLTRDGVRVKIQDQPFRVLVLLLERAGEIVAREELRKHVWPEGTHVDFDGSLNVILKKLRAAIDDDSDNPRFIETVPRRGYRFIAPVSVGSLDNAAAAAQQAAPPDVINAASAEAPGQPNRVATAPSANQTRPPILAYAASVMAIAALLVAARFAWYRKAADANRLTLSAQASAPLAARRSIAVLGFGNVTGRPEDAWLGTAFAEMLRTELAGGEKLRLVSGEDVANLRVASPWPQVDMLDQKTAARIGASLDSDLLVLGSYTVIGAADRKQFRVDVRLEDARTAESLDEVAETGSSQDLFHVVSGIGAALRSRLGIPALAGTEEAGVLASVPLDPDAARFYALGLTKLRQFDALGAKDLLEQCTKADPKFSLGHAMLARAWAQLGYEQKRREQAKLALDLSSGLPRTERMLVEGDYYESIADHERAASAYGALFELFPDNLDYGLQLAGVEVFSGRSNEAMKTVGRLRRLPPPACDDPRIDLLEARAIPNNKKTALALAEGAVRKATAQGNKMIYAQARKEECMILNYTDTPDLSVPACEDAYNTYLAEGNRVGAADAIRLIGDYQGSRGQAEAVATYERALKILDGLGEHEKTGAILNNMAIHFANQGKLDRAEQLYVEAKSHFERAGDKTNTATAVGNIADIRYLRGDLAGAAKLYQQAIEISASMDHDDPGYLLYRLADLQLTQGHLQEARQLSQQAIDVLRPAQGGYQYLSSAMVVLGDARRAEGDLEGAHQQYQQALTIRQKAGEPDLVAESQEELADLAIEEDHPQQAESLLRLAIAEFEKENGTPDAISAYALLSRALVAQGRLDEARTAIQRASQLDRTDVDPSLKLSIAIQKARIELAAVEHSAVTSSFASTRQGLRSAVSTASRLGYFNLECDARLTLGELELRANPAVGRTQLSALAVEAREHGFEYVAHQAEQANGANANVLAANKP